LADALCQPEEEGGLEADEADVEELSVEEVAFGERGVDDPEALRESWSPIGRGEVVGETD